MTAISGEVPEDCNKCRERGYVVLFIRPDHNAKPGEEDKHYERQAMFCKCHAGQTLQGLVAEFRLRDAQNMSDGLLKQLEVIKEKIGSPDEVIALIDQLIIELNNLVGEAGSELRKLEGVL